MTAAVEPVLGAAARWRLLSLGFMSPTEPIVRELEALAHSLREHDGAPDLDHLLQAIRDESSDALAAQYHWLFDGPVRVSPYEGGHLSDPVRQGRVLADIAAFYRACGAEAHGPAGERPDHVGCELEFLAFLELKRLGALEDGDEDAALLLESMATSFLRDHAGRWLPAFFADIRKTAPERPVYRALAGLGERFLRTELERRGVECVPLGRDGRRLQVESDSFDCA
jgi:TorA maturation chaperone TorD